MPKTKVGLPYVTDIPPRPQPIPGKPIFFDLAYHEIIEDYPIGELTGKVPKSPALSEGSVDTNAPPSGAGLVQGILGGWWGGK